MEKQVAEKKVEKKVYTIEEVADMLVVTPNTVRKWLKNGILKGVKLNNKLWRIPHEAIEEFLKRGE